VPLHDFLHVMVVVPDGLGRREIDWAKDSRIPASNTGGCLRKWRRVVARCNSADSSQRGILLLIRLQGMQKSHKAQCSEADWQGSFPGYRVLPRPPNGCPAATPDRSQQGIGYRVSGTNDDQGVSGIFTYPRPLTPASHSKSSKRVHGWGCSP
jgi:hypothetical protein